MQTVNISDFRAHLRKYLKKAQLGEEIMITSNGQFLASIVPPCDQRTKATEQLTNIAASAVIGDIISPTGEQWDALQ